MIWINATKNATSMSISSVTLIPKKLENTINIMIPMDGNMTATLVDEGASGSSVVNCQDAAGDDLTITTGFNSINTVGLMFTSVLPDDCESIQADVANGDHIIIALTIDITEEG